MGAYLYSECVYRSCCMTPGVRGPVKHARSDRQRRARRVVLHTREVAVSVFVVLILAMTSATVAGQLAATLSPTQRSLYWFMRCICVELQCVFAVVFPVRNYLMHVAS